MEEVIDTTTLSWNTTENLTTVDPDLTDGSRATWAVYMGSFVAVTINAVCVIMICLSIGRRKFHRRRPCSTARMKITECRCMHIRELFARIQSCSICSSKPRTSRQNSRDRDDSTQAEASDPDSDGSLTSIDSSSSDDLSRFDVPPSLSAEPPPYRVALSMEMPDTPTSPLPQPPSYGDLALTIETPGDNSVPSTPPPKYDSVIHIISGNTSMPNGFTSQDTMTQNADTTIVDFQISETDDSYA